MTCDDVLRSETIEKYLHEQLSDELREAFEQHYFECGNCFGLLQTYRDLQAELARTRDDAVTSPRRRWVWQWAWVPATAVVCLAVGVALWQRPPIDDSGATAVTRPPAASPPEGPPLPAAPQQTVSLADLARVDPPRYSPIRLRGAGDEATAQYQEAMRHYERGDYPAAISGLRAATKLDSQAPHIVFFIGISHLMAAQPDAAADALRQTIALGDSPYVDDAHFYLAKAYLQQGNVEQARTELQRTVKNQGAHEAEARQLLLQLERVATPPK